jgi:glutamine synthetase
MTVCRRASSAATRTSSCDPSAGTLARIPWYDTPVAQVLTAYAEAGGGLEWIDPRIPCYAVLERYADRLAPWWPRSWSSTCWPTATARGRSPWSGVPGTNLRQEGIQYCMPDDLYDCNAFLDEVRIACDLQGVPLTAMHSEFSPGQWEINTHHQTTRCAPATMRCCCGASSRPWRVVTASAPRSWPSPSRTCRQRHAHSCQRL